MQPMEVGKVLFCGVMIAQFLFHTGRFRKAIELCKECLIVLNSINAIIGKGIEIKLLCEVIYWVMLGAYRRVADITSAIEYGKKLLEMFCEYGERDKESMVTFSLASLYLRQRKYEEAKGLYERAIEISAEVGNRGFEAKSYSHLGIVFKNLGRFAEAEECFKKALTITTEIGDRGEEANIHISLGTLFESLGEHIKAKDHLATSLAITKETGDRNGEAATCLNLGAVFISLVQYNKAKKYLEKAVSIAMEIGDREAEANSYGNMGTMFHVLGEYVKAKECLEKALSIAKEIGNKAGEAANYGNLGTLYRFLGDYVKAEENDEAAITISREIGDTGEEFKFLCELALLKICEGKIEESVLPLLQSIAKCEGLKFSVNNIDQYKISLLEEHKYPYWLLGFSLWYVGKKKEALYVSELGRARGLADLMSNQYSLENQLSCDPQSWVGIEKIMKRESNCVCLYICYFFEKVFMWIIKTSGDIHFREVAIEKNTVEDGNFDNFIDKRLRGLGATSPEESYEDRSFFPSAGVQFKPTSSRGGSVKAPVNVRVDEDGHEFELGTSICYKLIITPVAELLEEPEIVIVPGRSLWKVPFPALTDESGKCLSETFRLRIVPSLTTLKLIQDSPADYHRQTGALIVGDPDVGRVSFKSSIHDVSRLPCAKREASMVGEKLGVTPLLGQQATKEAVLQAIHSVSLIHIAAHGNAERGEIALAPPRPSNRIPGEADYLLTMADISRMRLRAKLVVLSCCHSGRGQIRTEGVVGIARAFLGSGARSVFVSLWPIEDIATEQFMNRFYVHLVRGESASECLHQAMKWMRTNGYSDTNQWAPFMLIGDNVTFDFKA